MASRTHFEKTRFFKNTFLTVFTLIFLVSVFRLNERLVRTKLGEGRTAVSTTQSASFRWHPLLFKILAFGQLPSAVDFLLLRFITDDSMAKIKEGEETEVYRVLDLATELDPAFLSLYTAGTNYLSIVRNDRHGALKILLKGERFLETRLPEYPESFREKHWPDRWRINFLLGYLYLFEFDDFGRAMASYQKLDRYTDVPEGLSGRAGRVRTSAGQARFALHSIEVLMHLNRDDPRVLEELKSRKKVVLENERLWNWNDDFAVALAKRPKRQSVAEAFAEFKVSRAIPDFDSLGERIFLTPEGRIDSKTRKILTLGVGADWVEKPRAGG